jgi:hypothetical protein
MTPFAVRVFVVTLGSALAIFNKPLARMTQEWQRMTGSLSSETVNRFWYVLGGVVFVINRSVMQLSDAINSTSFRYP